MGGNGYIYVMCWGEEWMKFVKSDHMLWNA